MSQSFVFTDGSLATGSGGITAIERLVGYDRQTVSSPFSIRRGSRVVVRRTVYVSNPDTGVDTIVNISGGQATAIVWSLLPDMKSGSSAVLTKTLAASEISLPNGGADGIYEFAIDDSDTVNLAPGVYKAELAIVVGGNRIKFQSYDVMLGAAGNLGE